jgi:hypothetical protein
MSAGAMSCRSNRRIARPGIAPSMDRCRDVHPPKLQTILPISRDNRFQGDPPTPRVTPDGRSLHLVSGSQAVAAHRGRNLLPEGTAVQTIEWMRLNLTLNGGPRVEPPCDVPGHGGGRPLSGRAATNAWSRSDSY